MALSGLVSFLCKSLFISQSTVNNRGSVASDLVLAKLLSKDNFFAVNSFPILSLGSFEDEALVTVYRDDPVAGATLISHFDVSFTNKILRASGEATIPVKKSKRTKAQAKALPVIHPRETVVDLFGPESEESEDDGERTQHIEGPNPENEVRLSQIDTSLALSANTIDVILRGGMSGEEEEVARVLFRSMGRPASPLLAILLVHPTRGKVMPPPSLLLH
ncbi:hypothetical protein PC120_g12025 [Phytophthora cactorum]|nr:hypothetical protein PC120_g12025 [Phytophthora cactorum]